MAHVGYGVAGKLRGFPHHAKKIKRISCRKPGGILPEFSQPQTAAGEGTLEADVHFGQDFPRLAALIAGNAWDARSYDALEKLYLDTERIEGIRAEGFRAIAKIKPERAAHYVIKEASTGSPQLASYAEIAFKEAYSTSVTAMRDNVMNSFKSRN